MQSDRDERAVDAECGVDEAHGATTIESWSGSLLSLDVVSWNVVAKWLSVRDIVRLSRVCRRLYGMMHALDTRVMSSRGLVSAQATMPMHREAWSNLKFPLRLRGHKSTVWKCVMMQRGTRPTMASAGWDGNILLWDLRQGKCTATLRGHTSLVLALTTVPGQPQRLISGGQDRLVILWDIEAAESVCVFKQHTRSVVGLTVLPEGDVAVSASCDHLLCVWDLREHRLLRVLRGHMSAVECVCVHPTVARHILSAGDDGMVRQWEVDTGKCVRQLAVGQATSSLCTVWTSIAPPPRRGRAHHFIVGQRDRGEDEEGGGVEGVEQTSQGTRQGEGQQQHEQHEQQQQQQQQQADNGGDGPSNNNDTLAGNPSADDRSSALLESLSVAAAVQPGNPDGRPVLCCVDGRGRAHVIDLRLWRVVRRQLVHDQTVVECAVALRDGQRLATSGREAVIKVWRIAHDGTMVEVARTLRKDVARSITDVGDGRAALTTYTRFITVSTECTWLTD